MSNNKRFDRLNASGNCFVVAFLRALHETDLFRELLDVVDSNVSALVVAPTSSGKTMVSYYAMKEIRFSAEQAKLHVRLLVATSKLPCICPHLPSACLKSLLLRAV